MNEIFTVGNLMNGLVMMGFYFLRNEVKHINDNIEEAKESTKRVADMVQKAHERIDTLILSKRK